MARSQRSQFYCKCGFKFAHRAELQAHVIICCPYWPRRNPNDKHQEVTREEWLAKRNAEQH